MDNTTRTEKPAYYYGTGRRKSAIARVRLYPGNGQIIINSKTPEDYFGGRTIYRQMIEQPLALTDNAAKFNVTVKVLGGGVTGQAGAVRHGLARALVQADIELPLGPQKGRTAGPQLPRSKNTKKPS